MLSKNIGKRPCIPSGNSSSSRHTRRGWFYSLRQPAVQTHHAINSYGSRLVVALPSRAAAREVSYSSVGFLGFIRAKRVSNCYMQEKKTDRLCGCVCVVVRLILVLVLGRQIVYGQNMVYLCLSKYTVFENTHPHIATAASETISTAASETEGVAAVSCMESHMNRGPLGSIDPNSIRETELDTECRRLSLIHI